MSQTLVLRLIVSVDETGKTHAVVEFTPALRGFLGTRPGSDDDFEARNCVWYARNTDEPAQLLYQAWQDLNGRMQALSDMGLEDLSENALADRKTLSAFFAAHKQVEGKIEFKDV